jgi:signal transduction histidine kinase
VRHWPVTWLAALGAGAVVAAEWGRAPGWALSIGILVLAMVAAWAALRLARAPAVRVTAILGAAGLLALGVVCATSTWSLVRIASRWPAVRAGLVAGASERLVAEMNEAVALARDLADGAAAARGLAPERAFDRLERLVDRRGPAHGVALFDAQGHATAWAGTQRVAVGPDGPSLSVVTTPFYLWLVARRQVNGASAVGTVLIARSLGVPLAAAALTEDFVARTGVGLRFVAPGALPPDSAVLDFVGPGGDTLFAVQPVPPEQDTAHDAVLEPAQRASIVLAALVLLAAVIGSVRLGLGAPLVVVSALVAAVVVARAPFQEAFGDAGAFSPATYYRGLLGPFSRSAGALALTGVLVANLALGLWRRGVRPRWWNYVAAVALVAAAPYLLQDLARGITPSATGASTALWMTWQTALTLAASALVLLGAALVRGEVLPEHGGLWPWAAAAMALALAAAGLWLWQPGAAWPEWYPYLWLPALLIAIKPMPLRGTLATVAVVSGTAAALLTWRATTEGRIALAAQDAEALGTAPDPVAMSLIDRAAHQFEAAPLPATAGDLYVLYRRSALDGQGYPIAMGLWTGEGEHLAALDLAQLDLPPAIVQGLARQSAEELRPVGASYVRVPGVVHVAALPLADGRVLTLAVGPRSRLVTSTRIGVFLEGGAETEPPYRLALSPPAPEHQSGSPTVVWRREGWTVRGERLLALPGGVRHVHAQVDLLGASPLLQRGFLTLLFDLAVLALLWLGMAATGGRLAPAIRRTWPRAYRSLRARLTASLACFFVAPSVAFALWGYARFGEEFRRSRELLLRQTLRDASAVVASDQRDPGVSLYALASRLDADLAMSQGGRLVAASAPVLADLGLLDVLVPPDAFRRLAYGDGLELTLRQEASPGDVLAGYRMVRSGDPSDAVILGAVELMSDVSLRRREEDLGIATLVGTALGLLAAMVLSGLAARALDQPIQQLRGAALAVGAGEALGPRPDHLPGELDPVYGALAQAAADVERSQRAERVLAWGEMARQVAHEIKNPLTPIRLGIQHLLRVHRERPAELGSTLTTSGQRLLAEIDRLDSIARTFSRFALPAAEGPALEAVDVVATVREVVNLYRLGEGPVAWELDVAGAPMAQVRRGELVEVLVNLLENARDAGARRVGVRVRPGPADAGAWAAEVTITDDGRGIPADLLPRVFEPRFSTTSSGSGLGLAIVKRLVDDWGAEVALASREGSGTEVTVRLRAPSPSAAGPAV